MSQEFESIATETVHKGCKELRSEILACLKNGQKLATRGYQGHIYVAQVGDKKVIIKSAAGWGVATWINRWMLRREYNIYRRLDGVNGIPRCFGFFLNRYLVLEHVDAPTMRDANILDQESFLVEMLDIIKAIHSRGVAHGDLKRKDNILVTRDSKPYLIDFGVSIIRKRGFYPINYFWHRFCHQHDLNAWLKHKYGRDLVNMSPEDTRLHRPLWCESISRVIKSFYKRPIRWLRQRSRWKKRGTQTDDSTEVKEGKKRHDSDSTSRFYKLGIAPYKSKGVK